MTTLNLQHRLPTALITAPRPHPRLAAVAALWRETLDTVRGLFAPVSGAKRELGGHIARDLGLH